MINFLATNFLAFKKGFVKALVLKSFFALALCVSIGCTQNVLLELGSKSTDESLLIDAKKAMNNQEYQLAVDIITTQMSTSAQQTTDVKIVLSGSYAGLCGLNFLNFVESLSDATSGNAFGLVSIPFVGSAVAPAACLSSLEVLETIGTSATRTLSQNAFAAIVGMALMGSATRLYTDNSPVDGDGSEDSTNKSCSMSDDEMDQVILGFGFMTQNFSYLSVDQLGLSSQTALSDVINMCASLGGSSCNITTASSVTPTLRDAMRKLMATVEYGVGTVVTAGNPLALAGACP